MLAPALAAAAATLLAASPAPAAWTPGRTRELLDHTQELVLAPDLSGLTAGERAALAPLLEAGAVVQALYEAQRHPEAEAALTALRRRDAAGSTPDTQAQLRLYRLFQGPIATDLLNQRAPFLPVAPAVPGKNLYPHDLGAAEVNAWLEQHPADRAALLHPRTLVRRASAASLRQDLATLRRFPVIAALQPGLAGRLEALARTPDPHALYAVPYSVAYAPELTRVFGLLHAAAERLQPDDPELAGYLRNRARDLLANDYEAGDAAWVTGSFKHLDVQLGAYETYDDELLGVKASFGMSVLLRDERRSAAVLAGLHSLQAVQDGLPVGAGRRIRDDLPVGVYAVVADFGQARGGNTASILPNDALMARRYGRTILIRANVIEHPLTHAGAEAGWKAVLDPRHHADLLPRGDFDRTLWHEVGHYLGVDRTADGRDLEQALLDAHDLLEELKADLVSLHAAPALRQAGYYDDAGLRAVYAAGVWRTIQRVRPRRDQPYATMELMQLNWFLEHGLLAFDPGTRTLRIDYARYPAVVSELLGAVLELQRQGDRAAAEAFIARWTRWDPELHEVLAARLREQQRHPLRLFRYAALGEPAARETGR